MRHAIFRAKCDKRVHQKSLKADSLFGAKEQRKLCGSYLSAISVQSCNIHVCVGVVKSFEHWT